MSESKTFFLLDNNGYLDGVFVSHDGTPPAEGRAYTETPLPAFDSATQNPRYVETDGVFGWVVETSAEKARIAFKVDRAAQLAALKVTVDSMVFDADETSQTRMRNAIEAAKFLNSPTIPFWVLSDNTVVQNIPVATLEQVHADAILAMAALWLPPA